MTGLRPTFGRVSRYGAMTLSWTQDRLGPLCRTVEDCALVFHAIAKADEQDLSVIDLPFNWDAALDVRKLRVGYLAAAFQEPTRNADWKRNDAQVLETVKALGVTPEAFELPAMPVNVTGGILGAESRRVVRRVRPQRARPDVTNKDRVQRHAAEPPRAGGRVPADAARPRDDHAAVRARPSRSSTSTSRRTSI